jgi:hypothetical protein
MNIQLICQFLVAGFAYIGMCWAVLVSNKFSLDRNEIGCRRLNGRPKEKYPRKQLSEKFLLSLVSQKKLSKIRKIKTF